LNDPSLQYDVPFWGMLVRCHLSIEKALKGLYYKILDEVPPKTHKLLYLMNKIGKKPEQD